MNNGSSWCNAYTDLSFAIFIANLQGGPDEIRVAQQTYKPTTTTIRTVSFTLHNDLEIYGGYAGCGETNPDDRNIATYVTIMSGDIGTQGVATDNSYHVVVASASIVSSAIVDGFTITKGFADGTGSNANGAGIFTNGDPVFQSCTVIDNQADANGGGVYNSGGDPAIENCTIRDSQAARGAGIFSEGGDPSLSTCTITDNHASGDGGGMLNIDSLATIENCTFTLNSSPFGGAILMLSGSDLTITNCVFEQNNASVVGGAIDLVASVPVITGSVFQSNSSDGSGGAIWFKGAPGDVTIADCDFFENTAVFDGGAIGAATDQGFFELTLEGCRFQDNTAINGGAAYLNNPSATLTLCEFVNNTVPPPGGKTGHGGAVWVDITGGVFVEFNNCLFTGNTAKDDGGAIYFYPETFTVPDPILANCTVADNTATSGDGGGVFHGELSPIVRNSVLWGNTDFGGTNEMSQIHSDVFGHDPDVQWSDWQGHTGGTGNINLDPTFVGLGDYSLASGSPCIDAAQDASIPLGVTVDLVQTPRELDDPATGDTGDGIAPIVDMGAYEYFLACSTANDCGDLDTNGITDDNCKWFECLTGGMCNAVDRIFADAGSAFGACPTDGFCNIHDANHAYTCFAGTNSCDSLNIDIGGAFGACSPDGFCNIHDANHAYTCFAGTNGCTCPANPIPDVLPPPVGNATISLELDLSVATNTARVRVFLNEPMPDMQGFQLHLGVSGGQSGQLDLVAVSIEPRGDFVFSGVADRDDAFNVATGQMLSLLELGGVATRANAYLATFTYRVSAEALGDFVIDVLHDASLEHQTFLVASDAGRIEVNPVTPGVIQTGRSAK